MFDDPKKELERLEEELLAAEAPDDEFEQMYSEILEEFGEKEPTTDEEYLRDMMTEPPVRNHANGYGTRPVQNRSASANPRPAVRPNVYEDTAARSVPAPKKSKVNRNLMIAICVECLGIAGVVVWWMLRLM